MTHLASQYPAISPGTATERGPLEEREESPLNMSTEDSPGASSLAFRQRASPEVLDIGGWEEVRSVKSIPVI